MIKVLTPIPVKTVAQTFLHNYALSSAFTNDYTLLQELGSGGFGFVCSAICHADGSRVAVKFLIKSKIPLSGWVDGIPVEVQILKSLSHPNIIAFVDYLEDDTLGYLVTELHGSQWTPSNSTYLSSSPSMDLFECIEEHDHLSERESRHVFKQLVDAIGYLHLRGLCHRDIKDENILINSDFDIKLIDFGSCTPFDDTTRYDRFLGTIQYASPEILAGNAYSGPESDVWALGCCLYIMLTGQVPFSNARSAMNSSMNEPKVPLSPSCLSLLNGLFQKNPCLRPCLYQISEHPWLCDS